jgi:hypothetical protein
LITEEVAKVHRLLEVAKDQWQRVDKQQHLRLVADRPVVDMDMEPEEERLEVHQSTYLRCAMPTFKRYTTP